MARIKLKGEILPSSGLAFCIGGFEIEELSLEHGGAAPYALLWGWATCLAADDGLHLPEVRGSRQGRRAGGAARIHSFASRRCTQFKAAREMTVTRTRKARPTLPTLT